MKSEYLLGKGNCGLGDQIANRIRPHSNVQGLAEILKFDNRNFHLVIQK